LRLLETSVRNSSKTKGMSVIASRDIPSPAWLYGEWSQAGPSNPHAKSAILGRSCHTAIAEAAQHLQDGYGRVVDIDLDKFLLTHSRAQTISSTYDDTVG